MAQQVLIFLENLMGIYDLGKIVLKYAEDKLEDLPFKKTINPKRETFREDVFAMISDNCNRPISVVKGLLVNEAMVVALDFSWATESVILRTMAGNNNTLLQNPRAAFLHAQKRSFVKGQHQYHSWVGQNDIFDQVVESNTCFPLDGFLFDLSQEFHFVWFFDLDEIRPTESLCTRLMDSIRFAR